MSTHGSLRFACSLVLGSLLGLACKGSKSPGGWYDACCDTCTEGHCVDCSSSKGDCGNGHAAECIQHDGGLMCREKQAH